MEDIRQPLEDDRAALGRARGTIVFPAKSMLVGAMNPCSSGYWGGPPHARVCPEAGVSDYKERLRGPLLHRIDLDVLFEGLAGDGLLQRSVSVRLRMTS